MLLVSLSLPVRKLGLWLVVPLFPLLPLVVGCLIVLLPCAFGIVALSLARLNISLGIVLPACVMSLNLLPFTFCLLGMVGLLLIKRVTLMLCKLGWFVCKRFFGPLSILDLCLLVCCWSWRPSGSLVLPTCTPFGVALPSRASPLGWFVLFGFLPLGFLSAVLVVFFVGLFVPLVLFGRLGLPTPWFRLFPLGFHLRCSWRAFIVGCCCRCCCYPLVLRCLFGGSSDQNSDTGSGLRRRLLSVCH